MRSLLPQLKAWRLAGERFALATVVHAEGSSPRVPGECLLVNEDGLRFAGAVSSGCLENEVIAAAGEVLAGGGARSLHFGPDGTPPWREGLSCGGGLEVLVEPWWGCLGGDEGVQVAEFVIAHLEADEGCLVLSRGSRHLARDGCGGQAGAQGAFSPAELALADGLLARGGASLCTGVGAERVFIRVIHRRRRLLLVGGPDLAVRLVPLARAADFHVTVLDPRRAYVEPARFPCPPDLLLCVRPGAEVPLPRLGARDAALVISHDPKIDDPALLELLRGEAGYIGALGSATSHAARLGRLSEAGVPPEALARIEGPAGPRLGRDADAVALGLLAGVVRGTRRLAGA